MLVAAVIALAAPLPPPAASDLAADLQHLVRLTTPAERQERARELARRKSVSIEDWLRTMGTFGSFEEVARGTHVERAELRVGDEVENTELHLHVPVDYDPTRPAPLLLLQDQPSPPVASHPCRSGTRQASRPTLHSRA